MKKKIITIVLLLLFISMNAFLAIADWSSDGFGGEVIVEGEHSPVINNVTAYPIIVDIGDNVNVTCNVTDDDGDLDTVWLNVTYPDSSTTNNSMSQYGATTLFYRNTTYNQEGNHTFFIWANDTGGHKTMAIMVNGSVADDFGARSYSNNNGTNNWYDDWEELGVGMDDDPLTGNVSVSSDTNMTPTENYNLQISWDGDNNHGVARKIFWGSTFATNGTIEFDWRCDSVESTSPTEKIGIYVIDPELDWVCIGYIGSPTNPTTYNHWENNDLSSLMNDYFSIMFYGNTSVDTDDYFYIDNLYINYSSDDQIFQVLSGGAPNDPPVISEVFVQPTNGSIGIGIDYPYPNNKLGVYIEDIDGDSFNWSIECSTGDNNTGTEDDDGQCVANCSIAGSLPLDYSTTYTWWVNITMYTGDTPPNNRTFTFTTESENNPPVINISSASPSNGSTDITIALSDLQIYIYDNESTFNWSIECSNGNSSNANGANNGTKECPVDGGGPLSYSTEYFWWVNVTDGEDWTNATLNFTTSAEPVNHPPLITSPSPSDHSTDVSVSITTISVTITDADGDTFNWSIENSLGDSNSGNGASNGSKSCTLAGLSYDDNVTWWVNVSDGATNKTYEFLVESEPPGPFEQLSENIRGIIAVFAIIFILAIVFGFIGKFRR